MSLGHTPLLDRIGYRILSAFSEEKLRIMMAVKEGGRYASQIEQTMSRMRPVEIKDWRAAVTAAKNPQNPNRNSLIDIYNNALLDLTLSGMIERRKLKVQGARFRMVDKKGKEVPEATELLQKPWFTELLGHFVDSIFEGTTVVEFTKFNDELEVDEITLIPRKHVKPHIGHIVKKPSDQKGWDYKNGRMADYYVQIGKNNWLGELEKICPVTISKKYAVGSWLQHTEMFSKPFRWLITPSNDKKRLNELNDIMYKMGDAGYAVVTEGEQMQLIESGNNDPHKIYAEIIKMLDSQMSIAILGQDGTTKNNDSTGTYGSLKTLLEVAEEFHGRDKYLAGHWLQKEIIPRLIKFGYPFQGLKFEWDEAYDMSVPEYIDAVIKLSAFFLVDPKQVTEKTGIEIVGVRNNGFADSGQEDPKKEDPPPTSAFRKQVNQMYYGN